MEDLSGNVKDIQYFRAKRLWSAKKTSKLVCLNFKVPLQGRHDFKAYAALHDMTTTELLMRLLWRTG
jgi:hypothetical protein